MIRRSIIAALLFSLFQLLSQTDPLEANATSTHPDQGFISRYRDALAIDPDNLDLRYLLGVSLLDADRNREALDEFRKAYPAYRESIEANYNLAVASVREGDLDGALLYLDQAEALGAAGQLQLYPLQNLYFNLALTAQERNQSNDAIRLFRKVLALDPTQTDVYRQLGDLYARQGETALAIDAFHHYLGNSPGDPVSRDYLYALEFNRAQDRLAAGDLQGAATAFKATLEIDADSPAALYYLGYIAYSSNQPAQAVGLLRKAYPSADDTLRAGIRPLLYNCSLSLKDSGQPGEALAAAALLADQEDADYRELFLAGTLSMDQGLLRNARRYLQRSAALRPDDPATLQNLIAAENGAFNEWLEAARSQIRSGDFQAAATALDEAAQLRPDSSKITTLRAQLKRERTEQVKAYLRTAEQALQENRFNAALADVGKALELGPEDPDAQFLLDRISRAFAKEINETETRARAELDAGNWQEAGQKLEALLTLDPQNHSAREALAQVEAGRQQALADLVARGQKAMDLGQLTEARTHFTAALQIDPELDSAQAGLDAADQLRANLLDEYLQKGIQATDRGLYNQAADWLDKAAALDANATVAAAQQRLASQRLEKVAALVNAADRAAAGKAFKQAQGYYRQALALHPEDPDALAGQARLAMQVDAAILNALAAAGQALQANDFANAMKAFRDVLDLDPGQADALTGIRKVRAGQSAQIAALLAEATRLVDAGNLAAAGSQLSRVQQLDPHHAELRALRTRIEQLQLAGAQPGDEQQIYLQGVAFYTQGQYQEAIKSWETVLMLDPGHDKARLNIEKTRRKLRQIEEFRGG